MEHPLSNLGDGAHELERRLSVYYLSRAILMAAVIVSCVFIAGGIAELWPLSEIVILVLVIAGIRRKGYKRLTTVGSAWWAERDDLRRAGMLNAKAGLIVGRVHHRSPFRLSHGIGALFRSRNAEDACRSVMAAFGRNRVDSFPCRTPSTRRYLRRWENDLMRRALSTLYR